MLLSIIKKRREAEDILQETFIAIWNKAVSSNPDHGNVYGWIVILARNKAIHHMRQKKSDHIKESFSFIEAPEYDPMETTIFADRSELVKQALNKIPGEESEIIKLAYQRGLNQSEIANYLELPLDTVSIRMCRGMMKLKQNMEKFIASDG
jgi:RNA polymerase sigma-70 factor (ECF subfamily)